MTIHSESKLLELKDRVLTTKGADRGGMLAIWCAHCGPHNRGGELLFQRGLSTTFKKEGGARGKFGLLCGRKQFQEINLFPLSENLLRSENLQNGQEVLPIPSSKF